MDNIAIINLANGGFTIVDSDLFDWLSKWTWRQTPNGYAYRYDRIDGKQIKIYLHQLINGTPKGCDTDHVNQCKLDNRRSNLRTATRSQNNSNRGKKSPGKSSSKYKGVYWSTKNKKWVSTMCINRKTVYLGSFTSELEAAEVFKQKAKTIYGEFATN